MKLRILLAIGLMVTASFLGAIIINEGTEENPVYYDTDTGLKAQAFSNGYTIEHTWAGDNRLPRILNTPEAQATYNDLARRYAAQKMATINPKITKIMFVAGIAPGLRWVGYKDEATGKIRAHYEENVIIEYAELSEFAPADPAETEINTEGRFKADDHYYAWRQLMSQSGGYSPRLYSQGSKSRFDTLKADFDELKRQYEEQEAAAQK